MFKTSTRFLQRTPKREWVCDYAHVLFTNSSNPVQNAASMREVACSREQQKEVRKEKGREPRRPLIIGIRPDQISKFVGRFAFLPRNLTRYHLVRRTKFWLEITVVILSEIAIFRVFINVPKVSYRLSKKFRPARQSSNNNDIRQE